MNDKCFLLLTLITVIIAIFITKQKSTKTCNTDARNEKICGISVKSDEDIFNSNYNYWFDCIVDMKNRRYFIFACGNIIGMCLAMSYYCLTRSCITIQFKISPGFVIFLPWNCEDVYFYNL